MGTGDSSINSNSTSSASGRVPETNPLLYTLTREHISIQPYWVMILQLCVKDILLQRLWNRIRYKTWSTTQEIAIGRWLLDAQVEQIREVYGSAEAPLPEPGTRQSAAIGANGVVSPHIWTTNSLWSVLFTIQQVSPSQIRSGEEELDKLYPRFKFDLFDFFVQSLPLLGHAIWYFYIQSSCMETAQATVWNCYNAFGYRFYNYIFVSYCAFFWLVVTKGYTYLTARNEQKTERQSSLWKRIEHHVGLWPSLITIVVVGAPLVPYLFTNVIPMAGAYAFILVIYALFWMVALVTSVIIAFVPGLNWLILGIPKFLYGEYRPVMAVFLMFPFTLLTLPILMSIFYNYSQYLYYGNDYYDTIVDEFNSRDTATYFRVLQASVNEQWHTLLNFI